MMESTLEPTPPQTPRERSAGQLLQIARLSKGWDVQTLAARLKVPAEKIVWLESNRFDLLGNPVFVRALASSVCRLLELDTVDVLARLPSPGGSPLEGIDEGLKAPFRGRQVRKAQTGLGSRSRLFVGSSAAWRTATGVLSAAVILSLAWWAWTTWWQDESAVPAAGYAVPAASGAEPVASAASSSAAGGVSLSAPVPEASSADAAMVSSVEPSWVEVQDSSGQVIISRVISPGETVRLEGTLPLRLTIGNAQATRLSFRGKWIDLGAISRDNVAKIELQ